MPKPSTVFVCQSCGSMHGKWAGRCDSCGEWNTLVEEAAGQNIVPISKRSKKGRGLDFVDLGGESADVPRLVTGLAELDRVTGGGLVPGSALLVGGDPGIGKSTLLLQAVGKLAAGGVKTAYISGEESTGQVRRRAKRLGLGWTYTHPSEVFNEMTQVMNSLNNITWDRLENQNVVMYPSLTPEDPGQPVVFSDGFPREGGRAKFTPASVIAPDETPDEEYPMILTTGRQLEHWHTGSMTRRSKVLDFIEPEAVVSMNGTDIRRMELTPGEMVQVATRRGTITLKLRQDWELPQGLVFVPFCYAEAPANALTNPQLDPVGKIPEFKFCAVKVEALLHEAAE